MAIPARTASCIFSINSTLSTYFPASSARSSQSPALGLFGFVTITAAAPGTSSATTLDRSLSPSMPKTRYRFLSGKYSSIALRNETAPSRLWAASIITAGLSPTVSSLAGQTVPPIPCPMLKSVPTAFLLAKTSTAATAVAALTSW